MSSYVSPSLRRLVADRASHLCEYCLIHERDTFLGLQIEHVVSEKHGGETAESNLALACVFCNRFKGSDIATRSPTGQLVPLFNPRTDTWSDHFRLDGVRIVGTTEIGVCTATLLGFNQSDRLLEREALRDVDRYPTEAAMHRMKLA